MPWLSPIIALALTIGAFGAVTIWIAGPSTALVEVGRAGYLPPFFHPLNRHGAPHHIILAQGCVVTLLSTLFILLPSVEATFQILNQLCTILFLSMYMMMFAAGVRLRYSQPDVKRAYEAPGGLAGMWFFGGAGFTASFVAFLLSFMPPSQINIGSPTLYSSILIGCFMLAIATPLLIFALRKPDWRNAALTDFEPLSDKAPQ
jgi:amino acid transporter